MSTATATIDLGDRAPGVVSLLDADGAVHSLADFAATQALVVVFVGNGCPTVRFYEERLIELHDRYREHGVQFVLVNSNNGHLSPPDTHDRVVERAQRSALPFPYLKDRDGMLARACGAVCTPHAFVFDGTQRLVYRGRIDDSRTGRLVTSHDLEDALADVVSGGSVQVPETTPFGCAIVW